MFNALIALINRDEEGQGLAEYALILALIAIVAIVALIFLGNQVSHDPLDGRRLDLITVDSQRSEAPAADLVAGALLPGLDAPRRVRTEGR